MGNNKTHNRQRNVVNLLIEQLSLNKNIDICLDSRVKDFMPFIWNRFCVFPHVSYRLNNLTDLDTVFNSFSRDVKRNIKSAKKRLEIVSIDDIGILLGLMDKTFRKQNMKNPWPKELITNIYKSSKKYNACKLLFAKDGSGNIHSGNLFVYDENVFYNLISGTDPRFKSSGAALLLLWEGINHASKLSGAFDFEGSMIKGINEFYKRFGGEQIVYFRINMSRTSLLKKSYLKTISVTKYIIKYIIGYNKRYREIAFKTS